MKLLLEAVARRCSVKRMFFKKNTKFTGETCARVNFIEKETLTQAVLLYEF